MIDVSKYEWLRGEYDFEAVKDREADVRAMLSNIQRRKWDIGKSNAVFGYFMGKLKAGEVPPFKNEKQLTKYLSNITSSDDYLDIARESTKGDKRKFTIYGIVMAVAFSACVYCFFAPIKGSTANPVVMTISGFVFLAVTAWAYRVRFDIFGRYSDETNTLMLHDAIFVFMAILVKAIAKSVLDITIILMFFDVYFTSKDLNETIDKILK